MTGTSATSVHEDVESSDVSDKSQVALSALPRAILSWIFEYLDGRNVNTASQVCKEWYAVATAEPLWRRLAARTYPPHTLRTEPYGGSFRVLVLDGNRQNALAAIGLEMALSPHCGGAAAAVGISAGIPTASAAANATATTVGGSSAAGPHPHQQQPQQAVPFPPTGTNTADLPTGPAVTPGGGARRGPWSTPRSCSSLWRHNTHARFYQCRVLAMELRAPDVDPRTGLLGSAVHPPGRQHAGEEGEDEGRRGGKGKGLGGAAAGAERAGAGKAERRADVPPHGALRVYFDARGEVDLRDARSSCLAVVQIADRTDDDQQKSSGSSSKIIGTSAGQDTEDDADSAAGRSSSSSLLSRGMQGLSRMVGAAGKKVAAGLRSGIGTLPQQGPCPSSAAPCQQGDEPGRSAGPPGWDAGQLAAEGLWEGEAVWDRDGWPAAPATVAVGLRGNAWEPDIVARRPVLQSVVASARPTASWIGEVAPGHAKGCLEWRGEGLERLLAALLTTPHAALVFVYANGLEVTPEGKASSAFMSSYSPDYAPALLLRTPPSWAAAEARARGGTRRGQTQGSAQPELLRARAEAFVRMWRRRALFIGPDDLARTLLLETEDAERARWAGHATTPPEVLQRGEGWWRRGARAAAGAPAGPAVAGQAGAGGQGAQPAQGPGQQAGVEVVWHEHEQVTGGFLQL